MCGSPRQFSVRSRLTLWLRRQPQRPQKLRLKQKLLPTGLLKKLLKLRKQHRQQLRRKPPLSKSANWPRRRQAALSLQMLLLVMRWGATTLGPMMRRWPWTLPSMSARP